MICYEGAISSRFKHFIQNLSTFRTLKKNTLTPLRTLIFCVNTLGYTSCILYIKAAFKSFLNLLKNLQINQTVHKRALWFQNKSFKSDLTTRHKKRQMSPLSRHLASAGEGRNAGTMQENTFSKSSLFLSLITAHLCFSPDIKTNPSWLSGRGACNFHRAPVT